MELLKDKVPEDLMSGKTMGKKLKKRHSSSFAAELNDNFEDSFENKKPRKKKKKDAELSESLEDLLGDGKNKEKKHKRHSSDTMIQLNETFEEGFDVEKPVKKNKKNRLSSVVAETKESFEVIKSKTSANHGNKRLSSVTAGPSESFEDSSPGKHHMKKKKKKKKQLLSALATGLIESFEHNSEDSSPKRKRKKSRGQENLSMSGDILGNTEMESVLESPFKINSDMRSKHKKKSNFDGVKSPTEENLVISQSNAKKNNKGKRKSFHKENNSEKIPAEENGYATNQQDFWSVDEELSLIDSLISKLDPKDNAPYMTTLRKINWGNIAIGNRTPEECSEVVNTLIRKISKYKTLSMILQEAKEVASDSHSRLKKILSAKLRFVLDYCKKHKSEFPSSELRSKANVAWSELSKKERKYYESMYENEVLKFRKAMDLPPDAPKSPFSIYYFSEIEKGGSQGIELKNKCRKLFNEMKIDEKIPYILESFKELTTYVSNYKSYKESHPNFDQPMVKLESRKLFEQYFEYLGMPKKVTSVLSIFHEELKKKGDLTVIESKNFLMKISSMYRELSDERKAKYKVKLRKLQGMYEQSYKEWKESLSEDIVLVLETYFENHNVKSENVGGNFDFKHKVEVCMAKPKFNNEPEKPASTPFKLFSVKFKKQRSEKYSNAKEMEKACSLAWKSLSEEAKSKYTQRCQEYRAIYKAALLQYVRQLGDVAKMYLGFKRKEHYIFFKEDIFEQEFPNDEYPIYVVRKKEFGTLEGIQKSEEFRKRDSKVLNTKEMEQSSESGMSDNESSEEDVSDSSDKEPETNVHKLRTTAEESSDKESSTEDEDYNDSDVAQAWETPKKSH
ncbi:nucleolar transcription factor 1-A-like [Palaemon carinicauda]|uniref:nucleolar transcription factor 1-A-like n=1 Tax=Palaemon carinicauda TaxID=392227 RepID=UPI0035B635A7